MLSRQILELEEDTGQEGMFFKVQYCIGQQESHRCESSKHPSLLEADGRCIKYQMAFTVVIIRNFILLCCQVLLKPTFIASTVVATMRMCLQGLVAHGKSPLYTSVLSLCDLHSLGPSALNCVNSVVVSFLDPTLKEEEKGLVNLGRILGPTLRNFHAPMRSQL